MFTPAMFRPLGNTLFSSAAAKGSQLGNQKHGKWQRYDRAGQEPLTLHGILLQVFFVTIGYRFSPVNPLAKEFTHA